MLARFVNVADTAVNAASDADVELAQSSTSPEPGVDGVAAEQRVEQHEHDQRQQDHEEHRDRRAARTSCTWVADVAGQLDRAATGRLIARPRRPARRRAEEHVLQRRPGHDEPGQLDAPLERPAGDGVDGRRRRRRRELDPVADRPRRRPGRRRRGRRPPCRAGASKRTTVVPDPPTSSSGVPSATSRPAPARRRGRRGARPRRGSGSSAAPSCRRSTASRMSSHAWRRAAGSKPVVGSSRNSSAGRPTMPRARSSAPPLAARQRADALVELRRRGRRARSTSLDRAPARR